MEFSNSSTHEYILKKTTYKETYKQEQQKPQKSSLIHKTYLLYVKKNKGQKKYVSQLPTVEVEVSY